MAGKRTILVGTVGHGVMRSEDDGDRRWGIREKKNGRGAGGGRG